MNDYEQLSRMQVCSWLEAIAAAIESGHPDAAAMLVWRLHEKILVDDEVNHIGYLQELGIPICIH